MTNIEILVRWKTAGWNIFLIKVNPSKPNYRASYYSFSLDKLILLCFVLKMNSKTLSQKAPPLLHKDSTHISLLFSRAGMGVNVVTLSQGT